MDVWGRRHQVQDKVGSTPRRWALVMPGTGLLRALRTLVSILPFS